MQLVHAIKNHEHKVCTAADVQHIHEKEIDCTTCHLQLKITTVFYPNQSEIQQHTLYSFTILETSSLVKELHFTKKSSRAPPSRIV